MPAKKSRLIAAAAVLGLGVTATVGYAVAQSTDGVSQPEGLSVPGPTMDRLPARIAVSGPDGNWAGFADQAALTARPNMDAHPGDPQAAVDAYWHEMVPLTKTEDPQSPLVGYLLRGFGFVDLATAKSPTFDIEALLAEGEARRSRDNAAYEQAVRDGQATPPESASPHAP